MNLRFALCGFLAINGVAAFQPKAFGVTEKKRLLSTLDAPVWRTPMNVPQMVARKEQAVMNITRVCFKAKSALLMTL
jgi:hypothetical protein